MLYLFVSSDIGQIYIHAFYKKVGSWKRGSFNNQVEISKSRHGPLDKLRSSGLNIYVSRSPFYVLSREKEFFHR